MTKTAKPILDAFRGIPQARPPFWFMRQAGRYLPEYREVRARSSGFLDFCFTPELAIEATLQPIRRFRPDAAILFSDILVIPWALGQPVRFEEGRGPVLDAIGAAGDTDGFDVDGAADRLAPVYETVVGVAASLPDDVALIGFAGAPWTVATYMVEGGTSRDFGRVKDWAYDDPEGFAVLIDMLVEATSAYLIRQIEAGAEAVQLFDSWAGALNADGFERWVVGPNRAIADRVRAAAPDVPVIGFPRGAGVLYRDYAERAGVDVVALDTAVPPSWAAREIQPLRPVQGLLDPRLVVVGGDNMITAAKSITDALSDEAFVFNLGHGLVPETPPDHVEALAHWLRSLGG